MLTGINLDVAAEGTVEAIEKADYQKQIDEIYEHIVNKSGKENEEGFISVLAEMYAETVSTLTDETAGAEGNAATWTVAKG